MNLRKATLVMVTDHAEDRARARVPALAEMGADAPESDVTNATVMQHISQLLRDAEWWGNQRGGDLAYWHPEADIVFIIRGHAAKTFTLRTILTREQALANVAMRTSK